MSHEQLRRMLGQSADGIEVSPPPGFDAGGRRPGGRVVLAAAAAVLLVVAGGVAVVRLAGDDGPGPTGPGPTEDALLTAAPTARDEPVMDARITGRVALDDRGCVVLEEGARQDVAVWPAGWTAEVDGDDVVVFSPAGEAVARQGDVVSGGGGTVPADPNGLGLGVDPDARCFPDGATDLTFLQGDIIGQPSGPDGPLLVAPEPFDPSGGGMDAEIRGRLAVDDRGCVVLETAFASYVALWPYGWSADVGDRTITLRSPGGVVGRDGDYVVAGGGYLAQPEVNGWRCYPDSGEVAVIQSEVEVVAPEPIDLPTSDWRPGDVGDGALLTGFLTFEDGCVRIDRTTPIWPAGFTADLDPAGKVTLFGPDGRPLAYEGQIVETGGGAAPAGGDGGGCFATGEVFSVQSEVTVGTE